jgi:hypothetical protein
MALQERPRGEERGVKTAALVRIGAACGREGGGVNVASGSVPIIQGEGDFAGITTI